VEPNFRTRLSLISMATRKLIKRPEVEVPSNQIDANWKLWKDVWELGHDAQRVIGMRLARIAIGGPRADAERRRMVYEKFAAAAVARVAAVAALSSGKGIATAVALALSPVQRAVRANHRRLSRAKRFDDMMFRLRRRR
jgi:hypothetical protein